MGKNLIVKSISRLSELDITGLIGKLKSNHGAKSIEIAKNIHSLWKKMVLYLSDHDRLSTLSDHLLDLRNSWFWTLTLLVAMTPLVVFCVSGPPFVYFRYFLASLYILFLPGSMLIEVLYPKREELDPLERFALSIGSSLVLVVLTGSILDLLPTGIELISTTLSLAILTESLGILALIRKNTS